MNIENYYSKLRVFLYALRDLPLLAIRLVLCYGFLNPAMMKIKDVTAVADSFENMGFILPNVLAYITTYSEFTGVVFLALGLGTRLISIPLSMIMIVAIVTVHWGNGFEAFNNGFEIPLYYLVMLTTLIVYGAGRISIDFIIRKEQQQLNKKEDNFFIAEN